MYKKYLSYFYNLGDNWKDFSKYFDKDWIKRYRIECDYYVVKELKDDELNLIYASSLTKQVLIELDDSNKDSFGVEDRVRIVTELKNVPKLYVKVFEFNTLNYFKKTKQPFKTDVNLDGLIATKEFEYEFEHPPQKKFRKVFDFPHLDDQVGVFIIEFIANGYSSRATIKKGALSLVHKSTIAGHLAFIIDEDRNICNSEDTGIWYNDEFFKSDTEHGGRIVIPYEKYVSTNNAILVHQGFAHLESFSRSSESYQFDTSFVLHPESLIMGNEATLLVRPKLTLNGRRCDTKLMENNTVILTTTSFVDNIPVTKTYENMELDNNNEISVEFQVPPNLSSVDVRFQCDVRNVTMGTTEKKVQTRSYRLNTNTSNAKYYEAYLRRLNGSYYYYALGKNGEALKNVCVNFTFHHSIHDNESKYATLYTDRDGKIDLGNLDRIFKVDTNFSSAYGD